MSNVSTSRFQQEKQKCKVLHVDVLISRLPHGTDSSKAEGSTSSKNSRARSSAQIKELQKIPVAQPVVLNSVCHLILSGAIQSGTKVARW